MGPGDSFEFTVHNLIKQAVENGSYGLRAPLSHVYHRKAYPARDRGPDGAIVVDVSIEVFVEGAPDPFLLWIWECKDYATSVPVNDVEEFHAKLDQIGSDRTKGTMISRSGFQSGAVHYAKSKGIGLARLLPPEQVDFLLHYGVPFVSQFHRDPRHPNMLAALTNPSFRGVERDFYAVTANGRTEWDGSIERFLGLQLREWRFG